MVYVDMLVDYGWILGPSCHLLADTEEELHEFAAKIGMKRKWFQDGDTHSMPHYDLVASKRRLAVIKGAIEIDRNQLVKMFKEYKLRKQYSNLTKEQIEVEISKLFGNIDTFVDSSGIKVTEYSETQYEVRGKGIYGIIPKIMWDRAIREAASTITKKATE